MIEKLYVLPSYYSGHMYVWEVSETCTDPLPWNFTIEWSQDGKHKWQVLKDDLVNLRSWHDPEKSKKRDKDLDPFYRVKMETSAGTYYSPVKGTYGDLPKRDYLIAKEIMRKEILSMRKLSGNACELWKRMKTGIKCTACTDEVTGELIRSNCPECLGSQYEGGFVGPHEIWATFSLRKSEIKHEQGGYGTTDNQLFNIRMIGHPFVNEGDVIIDVVSDRRYQVDGIDDMVEIRRVPIILQLSACEAAIGDDIYKIGEPDRDDDDCGNERVY